MPLAVGTRVRSKLNPTGTQLGTVTRVGGAQPECIVMWDEHPTESLEWYGDLEVIEDADKPAS